MLFEFVYPTSFLLVLCSLIMVWWLGEKKKRIGFKRFIQFFWYALSSASCENVLNLVNKSRLLFSLKIFGYSRVMINQVFDLLLNSFYITFGSCFVCLCLCLSFFLLPLFMFTTTKDTFSKIHFSLSGERLLYSCYLHIYNK